ncbi:MAG: hypothetical protein LC750_12155 [Actinobacteria bacterium]|nr:hypothetical protein [Actinomycetota bacterium]
MSIKLTEGHFAYAALALHDCTPEPPDIGTCMYWRLFYQPDFPYSPTWFWGTDPPTVEPGLYDVYFVSDGRGTLTFKFPGIDGSVALGAAGTIDATLQKLSASCPETEEIDPNCTHFGHGGATHTVRKYGFVGILAYSWVPLGDGLTPPGTDAVEACVYPSPAEPNQSSDPQDHPRGCPLLPTDGDWDQGRKAVPFLGSVVTSPATRNVGTLALAGWDAAAGPEYLGFVDEQRSTEEALNGGGSYAAWGLWVNTGIDCDDACMHAAGS